jgi:dolichol-phosphate mannosyltransferase
MPTYNERENIERVTSRLFAAAENRVDLLVIDDGSPDGTAELVKALVAARTDVHVIERSGKLGLGTAYVEGFRWGLERGYWALVEMDADLSHDPADVLRLLDALKDSDLAIGSRYVPGGQVENWSSLRKLLSRYANNYARFWLGYDVRDSTAGFRAYRAPALGAVDLATLRSEGYAFQIELTRRFAKKKRRIAEVPITFVERTGGRSKMSSRIVLEALVNVTAWGFRDRFTRARKH